MLKVEGLSKNLGAFALKDVSFTVNEGDYFMLLGPSGAGKSVILETIAGLVRPESGFIYLNNEDITQKPITNRGVGLVFQDYAA
ncbi:MAG TPA: ATP-binding cassette domain-containing protein, partial [Tenuifilaceae bacterium]|nr:ATP-binding cassette domain-containing protein [Tenuifilaceae bacterium]